MKRFILFFLSMVTACVLGAQDTNQNYIRSRKMLNNTGTSYVDNIAYYDGLSRPFQTVTKSTQAGTVKERLATLQEYDAMGRETNAWLPTSVTADYVTAATLKSTAQGSTGYSDTRPYNETVYEASPLNRVNKQYGAGAAWYSGHPVATDYLTNTAITDDVLFCKLYTTDGTNLNYDEDNHYAAGMLQVVKTTDEDGNASYTFTDKQGRTVLTRQMNGTERLDTYYVYDAKGNLCFVLQPMYQTTANVNLYAFQYKYDNFGNCTWKKLPGSEYINYEYNDYDQLVCSSDSVQRSAGKETFYAYDKFGRLTQQGERTTQTETVYLQNYYDSYENFRAALPNDVRELYPNDTSKNAKGSLTGTVMNVFGSSEKIYTAYYYDIKGRVIKTIENNLVGGIDSTLTTYTFTDQPATVTHNHSYLDNGELKSLEEVYTYTYDHSDRISSVTHKLNSNATVTLASYTYDNKGRMATKKLHGSTNLLAYEYNVRGWLEKITSNKFVQELEYDNHYNGNISMMECTANSISHSYSFTYDGVNRLLNAIHDTNGYTEKVTEYDKNGNIKFLQRYNNGALVDDLTYDYTSNQLTKVEDATSNSTGFANGASQDGEYGYDYNGNLTKDLNKDITTISYNSLNLPQVVTFSNGNTITYLYTADGRKLRTVHKIGTATTTTDYCGNVIYENGTQKLLLTEEGYINLSSPTTYYYYLKDHQSNNRVVINGSGTVAEVNHYYPFGGTFTSSNVQPYKYNGKELDTKNGLNWYDYGARHYDAALGRWHVVDPLAEKYYSENPYNYCGNNPINRIDPTGMDWYEDENGNKFWREGSVKINRYTNIGATTTIGWGNDIYINYFQNAGVLSNSPADAVDLIASSQKLQNQLYGENSVLSESSQSDLFNAIQSRDKADLVQPIGEFVAEGLLVAVGGKAVGWLLGKVVGNAATKGYESFAAFKKVYGPAGKGMAWHHIVGQHKSNISRFGAERIHNINNVVKLPHGKGSIHAKISGHYSSKRNFTNGLTVRDWLKTKSFEEQYEYGMNILYKYGWKP